MGYRVVREGRHTVMSNCTTRLAIPRHNPINAFSMGELAQDAGLTLEESGVHCDSACLLLTMGGASGMSRSGHFPAGQDFSRVADAKGPNMLRLSTFNAH